MQGFQIIVFEEGSVESPYKLPVKAEGIKKYWRASRKAAEELKQQLDQEYNGAVWIRS